MKNFPKKNIFTEPEGYFDQLPEAILQRKNRRSRQAFIGKAAAAAAVLVLGFALVFNSYRTPEDTLYHTEAMDDEIEFYIGSGYWQPEDILHLSDDPDAILDDIIASEWVAFYPEDEFMDDEWWF